MKTIKKVFKVAVIQWMFSYMIGSFISIDFNVSNWTYDLRFGVAMFSSFLVSLGYITVMVRDHDNSESHELKEELDQLKRQL